jgi:outer membrane protein assembly factor BamB
MRASTKLLLWVVWTSVALVLWLNGSLADDPGIHPNFPVRDRSNLSPPIVAPPIHNCALAVWVYGFVPSKKATVRVFANGSIVGQDTPEVGFARIKLTRPLVLNESITATQTVGGITSGPSYDPVIVGAYPALTTPVVGPDLYDCGQVVPVGNLIASTHVEVTDVETSKVIGTGEATGDWEPIITSKLIAGHHVQAVQIACPNMPNRRVSSASSQRVKVKPEPLLLPKVTYDAPIPGNDVLSMHNLLVGAQVDIRNRAKPIGAGLATAADNWASLSPPIPPSPSIRVTQQLCSPSKPSDVFPPTDRLPALILGAPICEGSHYVTIDNTILNANVVLLRGGSVIGYGGAVLGTLKLAVGVGVTLSSGDVLTAVQYIGSTVSPASNQVVVGCDSGADVITQHNNNNRTGAYPAETTLTPARVLARGMRVKYTHKVDGSIAAQPLYVRHVAFRTGVANGLFVATGTNTVYGLDANSGAQQWRKVLTDSDPSRRGLARGISATPVIDVANHRMYVLFSTKNQLQDTANCPDSTHPDAGCGTYEDQLSHLDVAYWLVALDYRTGTELARRQVSASLLRADGTPVNFVAKNQHDRPALLLDQGSIYIAFGMRFREEIIEYHGWVIRYSAMGLTFQGAFCTSRNSTVPTSPFTSHEAQGAGIWQGGGGLASDPDGNVYFLTGNAHADTAHDSYGDCFVKLTPSAGSLIPTAFIPAGADRLEANDADLGSGGVLTVPGFNLAIGGGKTGYMYLLNRSTMKRVQRITASTNQYNPSQRDQGWDVGPHLHGSPTYWRGPDPKFGNFYVWGEKDFLHLYQFNTGTGQIVEPAAQTGSVKALSDTMPGGMMSVSANGNTAGTGIVWATLPASDVIAPGANAYPGHLYAFNAETLQPLWDTGYSSLGKWLPPTIADGTVFIGTSSGELIAYELGLQRRGGQQRWNPFQPQGLPGQASLAERYPDEESIRALPAIGLTQLAPPPGHVKNSVLEGDGEQIYVATETAAMGGRLAWERKGSAADLLVVRPSGPGEARQRVQVRLSPELTWSAADGSTAVGVVERTFPAPEKTDAPWQLFRVIRTGGNGILNKVSYIQCVFIRGGLPPPMQPSRRGITVRVPYHAHYLLYRQR